jgi:hypothetical protein
LDASNQPDRLALVIVGHRGWLLGRRFALPIAARSLESRLVQVRSAAFKGDDADRNGVKACLQAKIAAGEIVHIDASLIRANVSWESLIERHVVEVLDENSIEVEQQGGQSGK